MPQWVSTSTVVSKKGENMTRTSTFFPSRAIGFDHLSNLLDSLTTETQNFPPHNIEKVDENTYRLTLALAGFKSEDIDIQVEGEILTVSGKAPEEEEKTFLHKGIATRAFKRKFSLAPHVIVENAKLENGLLNVDLRREIPEPLRPRQIAITQA